MKKSPRAISKRTRFEVFKRDQFRCQYCGAASPEVLLTIDHIKPVADGGGRDILNLVTACNVCNAGKAAIPLSDSTAVAKQMNQVRVLADRREQMAMLVEWRDGLNSLENDKVQILADRINARMSPLFNSSLSAFGLETVRTWIKKFGMESALYGIDQATDTGSFVSLFRQMEQYSAAAAKVAREPQLREFWRIRSRLRSRRIRYGQEWAPIQDMRAAFKDGVTIDQMDIAVDSAHDYRGFCEQIGFVYKHPRSES